MTSLRQTGRHLMRNWSTVPRGRQPAAPQYLTDLVACDLSQQMSRLIDYQVVFIFPLLIIRSVFFLLKHHIKLCKDLTSRLPRNVPRLHAQRARNTSFLEVGSQSIRVVKQGRQRESSEGNSSRKGWGLGWIWFTTRTLESLVPKHLLYLQMMPLAMRGFRYLTSYLK